MYVDCGGDVPAHTEGVQVSSWSFSPVRCCHEGLTDDYMQYVMMAIKTQLQTTNRETGSRSVTYIMSVTCSEDSQRRFIHKILMICCEVLVDDTLWVRVLCSPLSVCSSTCQDVPAVQIVVTCTD